METRANYILIGVFTLVGIFSAFAFLLWLAKVEVSRQYAYYDVLFDSVAGLGTAGDVRFNGLAVGQVVALELDEVDPSKVRVRIEIDADTPIKTDTVAQLQSQGVTGVSFVALSGGSVAAEALPDGGEIRSERSALQTIFEGAPEVLNRAVDLLEDLQSVVDDDNRAAVTELLDNLASASGRLDRTLTDFEELSDDLGSAAQQIAGFTDRLDALSDTADETLRTATRTLESAQVAADAAVGTLESADAAFTSADSLMQTEIPEFLQSGTAVAQSLSDTVARLEPQVSQTIAAAQSLVDTQLPDMTNQVTSAAAALERQITTVGTEASALIALYSDVGVTAQARLEQSEGALAAFEGASVAAQSALGTINEVVQRDLPPLMEDLRRAAATANRVIEDVGADVSGASDRLITLSDEGSVALAAATETFANANTTLDAVTRAMGTADDTLQVAEGAFSAINRIVDEDLDAIVADLRGAMEVFSTSVSSAAQNFDDIAGEVLSASQSASDFLGTLDGIVQQNRRQVSEFLRTGLPQFQRFIDESRRLVINLERLVNRIERDPARFLLGTQASEFNR